MKKKHNWKEIQEHYDNNGTYRSIEKEFGINPSVVFKAIKRGDLITRSPSDASKLSRKKFPDSFKMSDETKKKISISRTKYLKENPDQVPYLLNHSSKESYPEKYFTKVFKNEKLEVEKSYRIGLYELDFAIVNKKIDIEVDGSQHKLDKKIVESDKRRTKLLESDGWDVIRIDWAEYQKQNRKEKEEYIRKLISYINGLIIEKPTINIIRLPKGKDICECGDEKWKKASTCRPCFLKNNIKDRPSHEQLIQDIKDTNYVKTGEKYGVSDNTIRKWMKYYEKLDLV